MQKKKKNYFPAYNFNEIQNSGFMQLFSHNGKLFSLISGVGVSKGENIVIYELWCRENILGDFEWYAWKQRNDE